MAKQFHRVRVGNGETISFWFDDWSSLGRLHESVGTRGCIDLGIPISSSLAEIMKQTRKRTHRRELLNQVEKEIREFMLANTLTHDQALWKGNNATYRTKFSTRDTWSQIQTARPMLTGHKAIWFPDATPRYAFMTWLMVRNRVATGDKMLKWSHNVNSSCVLCQHCLETREHLFFECPYSQLIWEKLIKGLLLGKYTTRWQEILRLLDGNTLDKTTKFLVGYTFQNSIHSTWRERNGRRHREKPSPSEKLIKKIDKT